MAFWVSLAVFLAGFLGGLAYAVVRGIALWRRIKQTGKPFGAETARIAEASAGIQEQLDRASASSERLQQVNARLAVSRAKLDVQLQAIREARHSMRRLLWFLPGA